MSEKRIVRAAAVQIAPDLDDGAIGRIGGGLGEDLIEGDILDEELPAEEDDVDEGYQLEDEEEELEKEDDDEESASLGPEDDF